MFSFIADKLNVKNLGEMLAPTLTPEQELHAAIEQGLADKFLWLLDEQQVSVGAPNAAGNLPVHTAAYYGRVGMLETLLERGVDVNTACPRANTPLHYAAAQSHYDAVQFLVERGANPALRNRQGRTPYDTAKGDRIRQYLLPLQFRHEDPAQAAAMLPPGITPSVDPMAPKPVIAPPPMSGEYGMPQQQFGAPPMGMAPPPPQHNHLYMASTHSAIPRGGAQSKFIKRGEYRPIQADGFGTSVGNEELTAKYGNTREVKVTAPPPAFAQQAAAPVAGAAEPLPVDGGNPYSANLRATPPPAVGGYPGYGAAAVGAARGPPQFKIFNPKAVATNNAVVGGAPAPLNPAPQTYPPAIPYDAPAQEEEVNLSASSSNVFQ